MFRAKRAGRNDVSSVLGRFAEGTSTDPARIFFLLNAFVIMYFPEQDGLDKAATRHSAIGLHLRVAFNARSVQTLLQGRAA